MPQDGQRSALVTLKSTGSGRCRPPRPATEPIDLHVGTNRLDGGDLRCLRFARARLAGGDDLPRQRLDGAGELLGQLLQQLALGADLVGGAALVCRLQAHQATVAQLAVAVQQAPLAFQHGRLLWTGVQPGNAQAHFNIRLETGGRFQGDALAAQTAGQALQHDIVDVVAQIAGPAGTEVGHQTAIGLALQHRIALVEVVSQVHRFQQDHQAGGLFLDCRTAAVQLIEHGGRAADTTSHRQQSCQQRQRRKAHVLHHSPRRPQGAAGLAASWAGGFRRPVILMCGQVAT